VNSAGQTIAEPQGIVVQTMYMAGTNNYAIDSLAFVNPAPGAARPNPFNVGTNAPAGSIQVFPLPTTFPGGAPVNTATAYFANWLLAATGVQYEVALSKCRGDFSYYATATAANRDYAPLVFQPCGVVSGDTFNVSWGTQGSYSTCQVDAGQWYLNWRIVPGTGALCVNTSAHTCGQTFTASGS
jgi:hypothetical protein